MSEISAFEHLLQRALDLCIHEKMGTTWYAIAFTAISFLGGAFGGNWRAAVTASWMEKARLWRGARASVLFLAFLFLLAIVQITYNDHISSREKIRSLQSSLLERDATIKFKDQQLLSEISVANLYRQQVASGTSSPPANITVPGSGNAASIGQSGGVTAGTINGPVTLNEKPDRMLDAASKKKLLAQLPDKSKFVAIQFAAGTREREDFAVKIATFLRSKGYSSNVVAGVMSPDMPVGVVISPAGDHMLVMVGENK
jgi:hypothetical protein